MYAELKCKTNFSFLRGASHPQDYITQALKLKIPAIALTDRDGVYGIPKAYWAAKDYPDKIKLIVGVDLNLANHPRITVLAQNRVAYGLLCRIITASHQDKPKGEASLDLDQFCNLMHRPGHEGLIVLPDEDSNYALLKDIFGNRVFIPLSRFKDGHDDARTKKALEASKHFGISIVATNDVHFHVKENRKLQDAFTAIREGKSLNSSGFKLFSNAHRYLKSPGEMIKLFKDLPEAIQNTMRIAESCTFSPAELRYRYPSEWIPKSHTAQSYLEELVWVGAKKRYEGSTPDDVSKQLAHELSLIKQLNFADYFLTIYEIVQFARSKNILCQGRGSAANSAVCFVLEITAVDPVRMNLLFERFISVERGEPPDIDVDFEHERREEVIQHIYEKYGRDRAAMVSAVVTYQKRSGFREMSKAFGVEVGTLSAKKVIKDFDTLSKNSGVPKCREQVEKLSELMDGYPRHLSIHSGGFTLSADPIIEIVPVEPARMDGRTIIQWDKYDLDYLGLLKVDLLSLGMLSAINKTLKLTGLEFHKIPTNDFQTYRMIQKAETVGTFQIESRAQMSMLGRLQPKSFYDLVIQVAIVRPGPIVGNMVHPYLKRRRGLEKVTYPHPKLKDILGKTLGVPLFQEQIMKIAIELADFSPGDADQLRRAIGAWRSTGSLEKSAERLKVGLLKNGVPLEYVEVIFEQMKGFAHYGFPESHAASFALIAYASAYLLAHHPAEFLASVVNSQPMGFYASHTLIDDAKRRGVNIYPLDPNKSEWDCKTEKNSIRVGWKVVRGLAEKDAKDLIAKRPFKDLEDFLSRTNLKRDVIHQLAMGDAFKIFKHDQRHSLWQILDFHVRKDQLQLDLFSGKQLDQSSGQVFQEMTAFEAIREDYSTYGLSSRGHPMSVLREKLKIKHATTSEARSCKPGTFIRAAGLIIVKQRPGTAKGVTFSTLEDEHGFLDLIIHRQTYEKYLELFSEECFLIVAGKIQRDGHSISMLVREASAVWRNQKEAQLTISPMQYFW
jgi:error-prone DNA polymerase